jgi:hypothetical protein
MRMIQLAVTAGAVLWSMSAVAAPRWYRILECEREIGGETLETAAVDVGVSADGSRATELRGRVLVPGYETSGEYQHSVQYDFARAVSGRPTLVQQDGAALSRFALGRGTSTYTTEGYTGPLSLTGFEFADRDGSLGSLTLIEQGQAAAQPFEQEIPLEHLGECHVRNRSILRRVSDAR